MATSSIPGSHNRYGEYPKTMYISRTRSALPSSGPKSNSAMSSRTYSRIKTITPKKSGGDVRRNMDFNEQNDSSRFEESIPDFQELENEQELLRRMIDQQKQVQELRERQKRVLELERQLASMEASAEYSMEEKLEKLKTAKTRLDELQQLVSTIKSVENTKKEGSGDSPLKALPGKAEQVNMALEELNELKELISKMSDNNDKQPRQPTVAMQPVFPNSLGNAGDEKEPDSQYRPVLPEVSVVQYDELERDSPPHPRRLSSHSGKKKSKRENLRGPYQVRGKNATRKNKEKPSSPQKGEEVGSSEKLWEEMKRHQMLLQELRERRKELEELMNMTKESQVDDDNLDEEEGEEEYNDANASVRSNLGSPDESRDVSDTEVNDFDTSQSGRLFGLNEMDTRRLIDLIRNQKSLGTTTEKTTATWGSSSSEASESDDELDDSQFVENDTSKFSQISGDKREVPNQEKPPLDRSMKDAFTQLNYREEHEIDFRPPTRRRRNITQPEGPGSSLSLDLSSYRAVVAKLQEDLINSNATMHLLLEDQQALTKLLFNTLNLQQTTVSNNICYGISPDFLIYQLDNCSAQFTTVLKESKDLQWKLYSLIKGENGAGKLKAASAPTTPLMPLSYAPAPLNSGYQQTGELETLQSPTKGIKLSNVAVPVEMAGLQQSEDFEKFALMQKDEAAEASNDLFEALRDSIYSEAAILISQNETRPHFLIELFHSLQQLNTDYLRQHALYVLQDVIKGYIPSSPRKGDDREKPPSSNASKAKYLKKGSFSENTPSESAATSEDEIYTKLKAKVPENGGYDFSLKVSSASELSTPSGDETENNPFAADDLGSTVIHLDAALRHMREVERLRQEMQNSTDGVQGAEIALKNLEKGDVPQVNTKVLRVWIKNIVSEIIPVLKNNHDKTMDKKLIKVMQAKVMECVGKGMGSSNQKLENGPPDGASETGDDSDKLNIGNFFSDQLKSILNDCFGKFIGHRVGTCGEDLIVGLSEILFNELAFFYMMRDLGKDTQVTEKKPNIPTIKIDEEDGDVKEEDEESNSQENDLREEKDNEDDSEVSNEGENVSESSNRNNKDAKMKEFQKASPSPVTVDLSVSETKPLTSYGSGEDEEDGSGDDYEYQEPDVPTSMQQDVDTCTQGKDVKRDEKEENQSEKEQSESSGKADEA